MGSIRISYPEADKYWAAVAEGRDPAAEELAYNQANPGTAEGGIVRTPFGGYYQTMRRPNGSVYTQSFNADGTPKTAQATRTPEEIASGIGMVGDTGRGSTYNSPAAGLVNGQKTAPGGLISGGGGSGAAYQQALLQLLLQRLSQGRAPAAPVQPARPHRGYGAYQGQLFRPTVPQTATGMSPGIAGMLRAIFGR